MRLLALVALLGTAASLKLSHEPVKKALVKVERVNKIHHTFAKKRHQLSKRKAQKLLKAKWEDLTDEQEQEIEDWVVDELTTGDETITKEEAHAAIVAFGEKHGFEPLSEEDWEELEAIFDYVDSNGDGEIDLEELM